MRALHTTLLATAIVVGFAANSVAAEATAKATVVAEWNSLPYVLSPAAEAAWKASPNYGKVLLQGVKVDSAGTMYVSTARWGGPDVPATLSKLVKQGDGYALQPYPSEEANSVTDVKGLKAVLGFEIDRNDVMWILDQGHMAGKPDKMGDEKLVLWDIKANKELQRYEFTDAESDKTCSFLNDIVIDNDTNFAYITDSGIFCNPLKGGLIVYDRAKNKVRRILTATAVTNNDPNFYFVINGQKVNPDSPMLTGADGIALSGDKKTLYWTALTGHTLYALDTALLRDFSVPEAKISASVRTVGTLPSNTDGMVADRDGNIYMSALTLDGIMRRDAATGAVTMVAQDEAMGWPDTLGWGPDGSLYFTVGHLYQWVAGTMNYDNPAVPNFRIWKIDLQDKAYTAK